MYKTHEIVIAKKIRLMYDLLLFLYPKQYRNVYAKEMQLLFQEMYEDELKIKGSVSIFFWIKQLGDILSSVVEEHVHFVQKVGMKKYIQQTLHVNKYNITGCILLLPILSVFAIDIISKFLQSNIFINSHPAYALLNQTPIYWYPILFTWVLVFPLFAILVNLIPLVKRLLKKSDLKSMYKENILSILIMGIGVLFLFMLLFHDIAPCIINGLFQKGVMHFLSVVETCKNA